MKKYFKKPRTVEDVEDALGWPRGTIKSMTRYPDGGVAIETEGDLSTKDKKALEALLGVVESEPREDEEV